MNNDEQIGIDVEPGDLCERDLNSVRALEETLIVLLKHPKRNRYILLEKSAELIEKYGFLEFKNSFDRLLLEKRINKCHAVKEIEKYILSSIADTISFIVFEAATFQANKILELLGEAKEEAGHYAEERYLNPEEIQDLNRWKASFRQEQKKIAQQELFKQVAQLQPQGYNSSVYALELAKQDRVNRIEKMSVPIEYYTNKLIVKKFLNTLPPYPSNHVQINIRLAAQQNQIIDFILSDLLSHKTRAECLKNFKRYVRVADQLLQKSHADAAAVIISALNYSVISRIELEQDTPRDIQKKLNKINTLINPDKNNKAYRDYLLKNPGEYLSPILIQKALLFGLEVAPQQNLNVLESPFMIEAQLNCRKILALKQHINQDLHVNLVLKREMNNETINTQTHYESSLRLKPKAPSQGPIYKSKRQSLFAFTSKFFTSSNGVIGSAQEQSQVVHPEQATSSHR